MNLKKTNTYEVETFKYYRVHENGIVYGGINMKQALFVVMGILLLSVPVLALEERSGGFYDKVWKNFVNGELVTPKVYPQYGSPVRPAVQAWQHFFCRELESCPVFISRNGRIRLVSPTRGYVL